MVVHVVEGVRIRGDFVFKRNGGSTESKGGRGWRESGLRKRRLCYRGESAVGPRAPGGGGMHGVMHLICT